MKITRKQFIIGAGIAAISTTLVLAGCGIGKATEPFRDAPTTGQIQNNKATDVTMPDGMNNVSTKCLSKGIRVTVIYHGDGSYGAVSTVADPHCNFAPVLP